MRVDKKKFIYLISPNKINRNFYTNLKIVLSSNLISFFQLRLKKYSLIEKKKIGIKIKKIIGGKIKYLKKSQDKRNYVVDFTKVKKILKFKPKFSIEFGIKEILRKIKANNLYR